jgi:MFS family permease
MVSIYPLALGLLLVAGFLELSFNSMSQTLVQLHAPPEMRGRMIGVFSMAAMGMRIFSGLSVGVLGASLGIHWSLSLSAGLIAVLVTTLLVRSRRLHSSSIRS